MVREVRNRFTEKFLRHVIDAESEKAEGKATPVRLSAPLPENDSGNGENSYWQEFRDDKQKSHSIGMDLTFV